MAEIPGPPLIADPRALAAAVDRLAGVPVLVVGDVMLDHYLSGDAERISPEAPVPVVQVTGERHILGGAGNVVRNIAALGGRPELVSVVGADDPGRAIQDLLGREGVSCHLVAEKNRKTTIKTRVIVRNQQMVRVDREDTAPLAGQSLAALESILRDVAGSQGIVVVSDYGKGVVSETVMRVLRSLKEERGGGLTVLVDPKVVNTGLYTGVDLLTPNAKEAGEMAGIAAKGREGVIRAGLAIFKKLRCAQLCVTLGPDGMAVFTRPGSVLHVPTVARQVFDVTGAGDTVMAVLALALGAGMELPEASILANYAAGYVVGQVGTATVGPQELREALTTLRQPEVERWLEIQ
ncbi:bifunctional heptose 7-phosphate kinase/heptose 1-phosphate adenyltransferase [Fundidesulfovibrio soli]|uniref:bifunctional heptose 7-phosphate kinase/heptose 1-phosphate adenyltransferase n=1 Tax=Fundidesulfovibrio soli TaxID=2922716 RepID=UPI001FAEFC31|nr:bifunctional ADP-heptose synthase [Fundidesulfovibrio soli]